MSSFSEMVSKKCLKQKSEESSKKERLSHRKDHLRMSTVNDLNIVAENLFMDEDEDNEDINDLSVDLEDLVLPKT